MRGPRRPTMRPESGAKKSVIAAIGSVQRPAVEGREVRTRTSCRYSVFRNRKPPSAANAQTAITLALEKGTLRKKRGSISGSRRRASYGTSAASASADSANRPIVWSRASRPTAPR